MDEYLFAIVSNSSERILKIVDELNKFTPKYSFFSDFKSAFPNLNCLSINLLIIDSTMEGEDLYANIRKLRKLRDFESLILIVITESDECSKGLTALDAGADDYLSFSKIEKELSTRVSIHLTKIKKETNCFDNHIALNIEDILPLEDRLIIKKSIIYILKNIGDIKGVYDLSFYLGKSERIINKAFVDHLDKTAFEFIRDFRINKAKYLLNTSRMSASKIAEAVGHSSAANFSTAFKSVVGVNPREYRKRKSG